MEINWTFVGQTIEFILFVWLCMKFIWPPILSGIENRQKEIDQGLADAERGRKSLEMAKTSAEEQLQATKKEAAEIIEQANRRKNKIIEDAKIVADEERKKILDKAKEEVEAEANRVREKLRKEVSVLVVRGAEKILKKNVDASTTSSVIDELIAENKR